MASSYEYFNKYILLEKIATGGMAEVFLARAPGADGIGKFVAIKRILPQFADSPEFIDMFRDEAKIAINLSHSNIVSIQEFGVQNNQFFIVMDFVEGKNLRQILNKLKKVSQKLSSDQIVFICKEAAGGLDHAHRCLDGATGKPLNITHRDMSPQNIMVSFEGEVRIVDFGIAKAESQMETTRSGTLKGKFGYMSPEQAEGQTVDLRTDIFSLGIVLWELLANDRLFVANNEINTLRKIRDCQIPSLRKINPNINAELEHIVMKALTRDRNLRYQTAAAFHRDLNRFLNRQSPDFSSHDFAVSVKTLFADEILNNRKKFIEYARVPFREEVPPTRTKPSPAVAQLPSQASIRVAATLTDTRLDENHSEPIFERPEFANQKSEKPVQAIAPPPVDAGTIIEVEPTVKRQVLSETTSNYTLTYKNAQPSPFLRIAVVALFVIVGYTYLVKYYTKAMQPIIRLTNPILSPIHRALGLTDEAQMASLTPMTSPSPVEVAPLEDPTSEEKPVSFQNSENGSIFVTSVPSGAEIYIDGKDSGLTTPSQIVVAKQKTFNLTLRKLGYSDVVKKGLNPETLGSRITEHLQEAKFGYIDVDIRSQRFVNLIINGRTVPYESLPITNYPIPSNTHVIVRAEDPSAHTYVEQTVFLASDKHSRISLDLSRPLPINNRKPTSP